jgi:hypothetical protein
LETVTPPDDEALVSELTVELHSPDGNHATVHGDFLTAAVIYATVTWRRPEQIDDSVMARVHRT